MSIRASSRPLNSYLLRIAEVRTETLTLGFELVELRSGAVRRFTSLARLRSFLAGETAGPERQVRRTRTRRK